MSVSSLASELAVDAPPARDNAAPMEAAFDRCCEALYRYIALRVGNDTHLADDLMQQLWVQARSSRTIVPADEMEYWLRAIAKNLVRTHWRKQARRPAHLPLPEPPLAAEVSRRLWSEQLPEEFLQRREVADQLALAITELSIEEQTLIVGTYFEERSQADLARDLGLTARGVEGRLYRARQALRHKLRHLVQEQDTQGDEP